MQDTLLVRQEYDVIRSLTREVALALGTSWDVRETTEQGTLERPGAVIEPTTPEIRSDGSDARILELTAGYNIYAYPELGKTALESRAVASKWAAQLSMALDGGGDEGRPGLLPLYDFEDVPYDQDSEQRRPQDFMRVLDLSIQPKQSPDDERRFSVVAEVRIGWKRDRVLPSIPRTTQALRIGFTA